VGNPAKPASIERWSSLNSLVGPTSVVPVSNPAALG
jgi:hypothetical protein